MAKKQSSKKHTESKQSHSLNENKVALSLGILCAIYMLFLSLLSTFLGMGTAFMHLISTMYLGYNSSFGGTLLGMFWGFIDGYIAGYLFSIIYKKVSN